MLDSLPHYPPLRSQAKAADGKHGDQRRGAARLPSISLSKIPVKCTVTSVAGTCWLGSVHSHSKQCVQHLSCASACPCLEIYGVWRRDPVGAKVLCRQCPRARACRMFMLPGMELGGRAKLGVDRELSTTQDHSQHVLRKDIHRGRSDFVSTSSPRETSQNYLHLLHICQVSSGYGLIDEGLGQTLHHWSAPIGESTGMLADGSTEASQYLDMMIFSLANGAIHGKDSIILESFSDSMRIFITHFKG